MDFLAQAIEGIHTVPAEPRLKEQAAKFLRQWLAQPDFAAYRPQLEWLIREKLWAGLLDRFYQILPFGTGGRRGPVGVGPNRMNLWTLGASVQGHCEYLRERFPGVEPLHVAVAYDVRQFEDKRGQYNKDLPNPALHLSSRHFADYAAGVYAANGIHVHIPPQGTPRYLATPELSFAIRRLGAHGGLNISASHNPPDDNGGKFYDERGGQPVPPDDQIMADLVEQVTHIKHLDWADAVRSGRLHFLDDGPHRAYIDLCRRESLVPPPRFDEIKVVFTPLHGVGSMTAMEVLTEQGFRVTPVEEQMKPDGQFPNATKSPNPEVPESMDRAEAVAREVGADLVLATDPDADRIGGLTPTGADRSAPWRFINGNELAALLTHFKLDRLSKQGRLPPSPIVVRTLVTTSLVSRIARHFRTQVIENLLVGFKYVAEVLWQLEQTGAYEDVRGTPVDFVIASEESHGILATPHIRDKDSAIAALLLAELALEQKRRGRTVVHYLEDLYRQFGYVCNDMRPVVMTGVEGKEKMARMLDRLRASPPQEIGGVKVTAFEDLRDESTKPILCETDRAARNFLIFRLGERGRIALRPSGTEPKAKAYIEVCSPPFRSGMADADWGRQCHEADDVLKKLGDEFLRLALTLG
jgi:phosphoglucomutase/phosphomannomutase